MAHRSHREREWLVPMFNHQQLIASEGGQGDPHEYAWSPTHTRSTSGSGSDSDDSTRLSGKGISTRSESVMLYSMRHAKHDASVADYGSSWGKLADSRRRTAQTDDPGGRRSDRTNLLAEPRVRFLLVLYGLYMVRRANYSQLRKSSAFLLQGKSALGWDNGNAGSPPVALAGRHAAHA